VTAEAASEREDRGQILRELSSIAKDLEDVYYFTRKLFDDIFETIKPEADPRYQTHRIEAAYILLELVELMGKVRRVMKICQRSV